MKASKDNQLMMGIEAFLLGREWIIKPEGSQAMSVGEFYNAIDEIHQERFHKGESKAWENDDTKTQLSEKIRKRYEPYLKAVTDEFKFSFSFKSGIASDYEKKTSAIQAMAKQLLSAVCLKYSDESLQIILKAWDKPANFPTFLVCVRYAISFGFPIEFKYTKLMTSKPESRKIFPNLITLTENNLGLIGYDTKDKKTKSFLLSRISEPKLEFYPSLIQALSSGQKPPKFDYKTYLQTDPSAKFQKKERTYTVRLSKNNLDLLKHSKTLAFREVSTDSTFVTIEIQTHNEWAMFDMLFNYGSYALLLGPDDALARFKEKLTSLSDHYGSQTTNTVKKKK